MAMKHLHGFTICLKALRRMREMFKLANKEQKTNVSNIAFSLGYPPFPVTAYLYKSLAWRNWK